MLSHRSQIEFSIGIKRIQLNTTPQASSDVDHILQLGTDLYHSVCFHNNYMLVDDILATVNIEDRTLSLDIKDPTHCLPPPSKSPWCLVPMHNNLKIGRLFLVILNHNALILFQKRETSTIMRL
jgi:hypothetical protein